MVIVETPVFTRVIQDLLADDEYHKLQLALALGPEQGALIRGASGLRKVRWRRHGGGKRGGLRVLYYWDPDAGRLYMIYAYKKTKQSDLTPSQTKQLGKVIREELK